jgi:hypothetical protein
MSNFPQLLKEAAEIWPNETSAFEQIRQEGTGTTGVRIRLQAVEIMQQFVGDVEFGKGRCSQPPLSTFFLH